jgi:hypothetical protein
MIALVEYVPVAVPIAKIAANPSHRPTERSGCALELAKRTPVMFGETVFLKEPTEPLLLV